jgi:hypothetical protein
MVHLASAPRLSCRAAVLRTLSWHPASCAAPPDPIALSSAVLESRSFLQPDFTGWVRELAATATTRERPAPKVQHHCIDTSEGICAISDGHDSAGVQEERRPLTRPSTSPAKQVLTQSVLRRPRICAASSKAPRTTKSSPSRSKLRLASRSPRRKAGGDKNTGKRHAGLCPGRKSNDPDAFRDGQRGRRTLPAPSKTARARQRSGGDRRARDLARTEPEPSRQAERVAVRRRAA